MTKRETAKIFVESYYGNNANLRTALTADFLAVKQEWEIFVDCLCRDGEITMRQYDTWMFPWDKRKEN